MMILKYKKMSYNKKHYAAVAALGTLFGINIAVSMRTSSKSFYVDGDIYQDTDVILIKFYKKLLYGSLWPLSAILYYIRRIYSNRRKPSLNPGSIKEV
jgi:hypothetical protein